MTFLSLETPCLAHVLQPHSAVSNLSCWHYSIMHLPMCSPLSTNVLSGSYISRNNRGEEQVGVCYCTWKRKKAANLVSLCSWQLIRNKRLKASATHSLFFILLFVFFIPHLAGIFKTFYSNSLYCRTSWVANGNPYANRRLCVIMVFWGHLSNSHFCSKTRMWRAVDEKLVQWVNALPQLVIFWVLTSQW